MNRLANASSPYLLQHAANPVDWYPWGDEAVGKARQENRPIFLSIGYAACHWCHVMEREDFENQAIADLLNRDFVSIKVDREERPDIDAQYMLAAQIVSGGGGWPLSAFLTPELEPFFAAGRFFPPREFAVLLEHIAKLWKEQPDALRSDAAAIAGRMREISQADTGGPVDADARERAVAEMADRFDPVHGGFSNMPKFPSVPGLWLLLDAGGEADHMLHHTLSNIVRGGIHDHVGGGFFRYSTDERWLVPHFEKMLYDQGQLAAILAEAYLHKPDPDYRAAALGIRDFVCREMREEQGGFFSSLDADSEGEEGRFYVFTRDEVVGAASEILADTYGVTPEGNFEGRNVLALADAPVGSDAEGLARLLSLRDLRPRPATDDKALSGWNGLMISGLARVGLVFDDERSIVLAHQAADFVLSAMVTDGRLSRSWRRGVTGGEGFLADYAYLADGLLTLAEASGNREYRSWAGRLAHRMVDTFWDETRGGFFDFHSDPNHVARLKTAEDSAEPSANGVAARVMLRLGQEAKARDTVSPFGALIQRYPSAFATLLLATPGGPRTSNPR